MQRTTTSPSPDQPRRLLLTNSEVTPLTLSVHQPPPTQPYIGPGRLIAWGIDRAASYIEPTANRILHIVGKGPDAITRDIESIFSGNCESMLTDLHVFLEGPQENASQDIRRLEEGCRKLILFIDQQQTDKTLLQTFQNIVILTTRYPGLRRMLLHSANKTDSEIKSKISALQMHEDDIPGYHWDFLRSFASAALSSNPVNDIIESHTPKDLALASGSDFCAIERLLGYARDSDLNLNATNPGAEEHLLRPLAVRFLAGILRHIAFWMLNESLGPDRRQMYVAGKLCDSAIQLVEDVPRDVDRGQKFKLDVAGLDTFLTAILGGLHSWKQQPGWRDFRKCDSCEKLIKLLQLLSEKEALFPLATDKANSFHTPSAEVEDEVEYITTEEEIESGAETDAGLAHDEGGKENQEDIETGAETDAGLARGEGGTENQTGEEVRIDAQTSADPPQGRVASRMNEETKANAQTRIDPPQSKDDTQHSTEGVDIDNRIDADSRYINAVQDIRNDDIVIAFMGPTY